MCSRQKGRNLPTAFVVCFDIADLIIKMQNGSLCTSCYVKTFKTGRVSSILEELNENLSDELYTPVYSAAPIISQSRGLDRYGAPYRFPMSKAHRKILFEQLRWSETGNGASGKAGEPRDYDR